MLPEKFVEILNKVNPEIMENQDLDLVEEGIIVSLDIMNLVAEIESVYKFDFDPDEIVPETFASAEALWNVVKSHGIEG